MPESVPAIASLRYGPCRMRYSCETCPLWSGRFPPKDLRNSEFGRALQTTRTAPPATGTASFDKHKTQPSAARTTPARAPRRPRPENVVSSRHFDLRSFFVVIRQRHRGSLTWAMGVTSQFNTRGATTRVRGDPASGNRPPWINPPPRWINPPVDQSTPSRIIRIRD